MSSSEVFFLPRALNLFTIEAQKHLEVHKRFLLVHFVRCWWGRVREGDIMATIVIAKVDVFVFRVWHAVILRLATLIKLRQIVQGLMDNFVDTWKYHLLSSRFFKDDLPLFFERNTCTVGSNSKIVLHHRVNDGPLRV